MHVLRVRKQTQLSGIAEIVTARAAARSRHTRGQPLGETTIGGQFEHKTCQRSELKAVQGLDEWVSLLHATVFWKIGTRSENIVYISTYDYI